LLYHMEGGANTNPPPATKCTPAPRVNVCFFFLGDIKLEGKFNRPPISRSIRNRHRWDWNGRNALSFQFVDGMLQGQRAHLLGNGCDWTFVRYKRLLLSSPAFRPMEKNPVDTSSAGLGAVSATAEMPSLMHRAIARCSVLRQSLVDKVMCCRRRRRLGAKVGDPGRSPAGINI